MWFLDEVFICVCIGQLNSKTYGGRGWCDLGDVASWRRRGWTPLHGVAVNLMVFAIETIKLTYLLLPQVKTGF